MPHGGNSAFGIPGLLGNMMELGQSEEPSPRDAVMSDPGVVSLKRTRSPPKLPHPCPIGALVTDMSTPTEDSSLCQVSTPSSCMVGKLVDCSPKPILVSSSS